MVDYSRWDKLDVSDDDDDRPKKPRVQAFTGPQKVTIGGKSSGGGVEVRPSDAQQDDVGDELGDEDEPMEPPSDEDGEPGEEDHREDVLQLRALAERALRCGDVGEAVRLLEKAMRFGGESCPGMGDLLAGARAKLAAATGQSGGSVSSTAKPSADAADGRQNETRAAAGGTVDGRYSWSQTREIVEVNVFVPEDTKAKAVSSIKVTETEVQVDVGGATVLKGDWEFKVEPEEDPDWELRELSGRRVLRLLIRKKPLPGGLSVVVWWKRVLKGDPGIDIGEMEGRRKERADQFSKAWADAHLAFKEKIGKRTPISIDMGTEGAAADTMETS